MLSLRCQTPIQAPNEHHHMACSRSKQDDMYFSLDRHFDRIDKYEDVGQCLKIIEHAIIDWAVRFSCLSKIESAHLLHEL